VMGCAELVVVRFCDPKVRLEGEIEAAGPPEVAVPVRLIVCGLGTALSAMETLAVRVPTASGVKVIVMVQFEPAETDGAQVLVSEKSPASVPVMVILEMFRVALPVLNRVTPLLALVVPTAWLAGFLTHCRIRKCLPDEFPRLWG